jgi:SAM-dependent methyltransferase
MTARYDDIGTTYAATRRPDPRLAARIHAALGPARTVVNIGAGTGSYEPDPPRQVVAVEPSAAMIAQRPPGAAPVVQATAQALPFPDAAFDAALAVLTIHHWGDVEAGIAESRRVAGRLVVFTFDPEVLGRCWLVAEYLPQAAAELARVVTPARVAGLLGGAAVTPMPVPYDCTDGFLCAWWRRPEAYLDPRVRAGISTFASIDASAGLRALEADLRSGAWHERHAGLLALDELECGYRLVVT